MEPGTISILVVRQIEHFQVDKLRERVGDRGDSVKVEFELPQIDELGEGVGDGADLVAGEIERLQVGELGEGAGMALIWLPERLRDCKLVSWASLSRGWL